MRNRHGRRGFAGRAAAVVAAFVVVLQLIATTPAAADDPGLPAAVPLTGLLMVTPVEPKPQRAGHANPDRVDHAELSANVVTLVTTAGTRVEVTGNAVADAISGDRFAGTVAVSASVRKAVAARNGGVPLPTDPAELAELVAQTSADEGAVLRVTTASLAKAAVTAATTKAHSVDVMYLSPSGAAPTSAVVDAVRGRLKEFWGSQSNGQISDITRPVAVKSATLPASKVCDPGATWDYAAGPSGFGRKGPKGYPPDAYYWAGGHAAHLVVIVPGDVCGEGSGLGTIGTIHAGGMTWSSVDTNLPDEWDGVLFHEIGHNLGLQHSNVLDCDAPPTVDAPSPTCQPYEYEDYYDVMGGGFVYYVDWDVYYTNSRNIAALNVTQKARLGALPVGTGLKAVRVSDGREQQFTVQAASAESGVRGLEVVDPLNGEKLYVEYRSGTGRDAQAFYQLISAGSWDNTWAPGVRILKIGCTPTTACKDADRANASVVLQRWTADNDPVLWYGPGDSFASRSRGAGLPGVRITVVSTGAESAVVKVSFEAPPPVPSATPTISGTARIGVKLTAKPGAWEPGTTFGYQWRVAGKNVSGATKSTFVPRSADKGKTVTVAVTGSHPDFVSVTKTSKATAKVLPLLKLKSATPKISGKARVGAKLTAKPGAWTSGTTFSYQWRVSGKAVSGATSSTFVPRAADKGKKVTVRVTGKKAGYTTVTKTSKSTSAVK